ncbi:OsmC family protein [Pontibacter burrus]|uniref:OsmC family protein n=1 Tax=Pontibacter burrus TaxID=2704466 RepID=A0A6B3LR28_9BACT|nr:OsmC family protein [Pontibacter burrus]NEM99279.1 OsmC family protein [Pontibacter burrus]
MEINLTRLDQDYHFAATGASGVAVHMDANPEIGGHNMGARPMEMLLMGLGGCSAIDVIMILKKQRLEATTFDIKVTADREPVNEHTEFRNINLHFVLGGNLPEDKVRRAIELSLEKYCSVAMVLYKTSTINYTLELL